MKPARKSLQLWYLRAVALLERRGQDSNLRTRGYPVTDLANRRFRPLSHLSGSRGKRIAAAQGYPQILSIAIRAARYVWRRRRILIPDFGWERAAGGFASGNAG